MASPILLSPEVASAGVSALGSIGSSIINGVLNRQSMDDQINKAKGLMKYEWDLYKSPKAQLGSLAAAGFNPAVALGEGRNFSASINPVMPSSVTPQIGGVMDIANFVKAMAEAKKAGFESTAQQLQNEITSATMADTIKAAGIKNKWSESEIIKIDQEVSKITGELNLMHTQAELNQKQINWFDKVQTQEVNNLIASTEYQKALAGLTSSQKKLLDETMEDLKSYANYNQQYLEKMVSLLENYGDAEAIVGMVSKVISSASDFIGNFVPSTKVTKVIKDVSK